MELKLRREQVLGKVEAPSIPKLVVEAPDPRFEKLTSARGPDLRPPSPTSLLPESAHGRLG
jgi:hypothetical protein